MCVVNKQFELLEFVLDSVYVARSMMRNTGITGTTRIFSGKPYTFYPTEHLHPH